MAKVTLKEGFAPNTYKKMMFIPGSARIITDETLVAYFYTKDNLFTCELSADEKKRLKGIWKNSDVTQPKQSKQPTTPIDSDKTSSTNNVKTTKKS